MLKKVRNKYIHTDEEKIKRQGGRNKALAENSKYLKVDEIAQRRQRKVDIFF